MNGLEVEWEDEVDFLYVDATTVDGGALQSRYGVRGHPVMVVVDEAGVVFERLYGVPGEAAMREAVVGVLE
ncbi:MAG TPA: hypothetical protein VLL52_05700 [Anaerolineae bacterium]|nr:hypothetical protein [Anaerolineae bacterium]